MIAIFDNGASYSDHTITFVDLGGWPLEVVQRFIGGEVVAVVECVEWRDPSSLSQVGDVLGYPREDVMSWIADYPAAIQFVIQEWEKTVARLRAECAGLDQESYRVRCQLPWLSKCDELVERLRRMKEGA